MPVSLRHRLDVVPARNRLTPNEARPLLSSPVIGILPIVRVEVLPVLLLESPVLIVSVTMSVALGLPRRNSAVSRRRIMGIMSWRPLRHAHSRCRK